MRNVIKDISRSLSGRKAVAVWVMASLIAAATGPFGSFAALGFPQRALFWSIAMGAALLITLVFRAVIRAARPDYDEWTETLVLSLALAATLTPLINMGLTGIGAVGPTGAMRFLEIAAVVVIVPIAFTTFRRIMADPKLDLRRGAARSEPRIYQRLPEATGQKLVRISVRDHYVEVVTDSKSETLLMRFSDAISEAEGIPGLQVHRSHWVAEDAVTGVDRDGGRMFLILKDGSRVPVSRGFRAAVEEAGIDGSAA